MASMVGHHAGAIAMCWTLEMLTAPGKVKVDPDIGALCHNVTTSQSGEVSAMGVYLQSKGQSSTPKRCEPDIYCGLDCKSSQKFEAAVKTMHAEMSLEYKCEPSIDFAGGMIAHHKGAIDLCGVLTDLQADGTSVDAEVLKMCEGIVAAQTAEIAWMQAWLQKHGHSPVPKLCSGAPVKVQEYGARPALYPMGSYMTIESPHPPPLPKHPSPPPSPRPPPPAPWSPGATEAPNSAWALFDTSNFWLLTSSSSVHSSSSGLAMPALGALALGIVLGAARLKKRVPVAVQV